jgi:RNA polymerase sigma-70 factor (ECF subfamily)
LEPDEEIAVIQALREDPMGALKIIHERFYNVLRLYARKYVQDPAIAADLTQETFLKFYNCGRRFSSLVDVQKYLFKMVRNLAINHNRRLALHHHTIEELRVNASPEEASNQWIESEMLKFVVLEIKSLPNPDRSVVELILQEGLNTAEIAARLDMTPNKVSKVKRAAIDKIRIFLFKKRILENPVVISLAMALWAVSASTGPTW